MTRKSILFVDADRDLSETFMEMMALHSDFSVHWETSVKKAIKTARTAFFDLLIIEVGFPEMDGREAIRVLRKGGFKAPIVILTSQSTDSDIILGLEFGADDYVVKPFRFPVFLARIRALLRQQERGLDAEFSIGEYIFKPSQNQLTNAKDGCKVSLTKKETAILNCLYRAGPGVIPRNVLLQEVWGYNPGVTTHTVETHIYRLRQKIKPNSTDSGLLLTGQGGYRLVPS